MSNAAGTDYMEHLSVHAYLRDFDHVLQGIASDETIVVRQFVDEHFVSEFAADKLGGTLETVIREALDKLGPVETVTASLIGRDAGTAESVMGKSRILLTPALIVISALLVSLGAGFSVLLPVLAIVLIVKLGSSRARGILSTVNATVLVIVLVYLVLVFTTAGALMETVHSLGGF